MGDTRGGNRTVLYVAEPGAGLSAAVRRRAAELADTVYVAPGLASRVPLPHASLAFAVRRELPAELAAAADLAVVAIGNGVLVVDDADLLDADSATLVATVARRVDVVVGTHPRDVDRWQRLLDVQPEWLSPASGSDESWRRRRMDGRLHELGDDAAMWLAMAVTVSGVLQPGGPIAVDADVLDDPPGVLVDQRVVGRAGAGWSVSAADLATVAASRLTAEQVRGILADAALRCRDQAAASDLFATSGDVARAAVAAQLALPLEPSADRRAQLAARAARAGTDAGAFDAAAHGLLARELVADAARLGVDCELSPLTRLAIARQSDAVAERTALLTTIADLPQAVRAREALVLDGLPAVSGGIAELAPDPDPADLDMARLAWGVAVVDAVAAGDIDALRGLQHAAAAVEGGRAAWVATAEQLGEIIEFHVAADVSSTAGEAAAPTRPSLPGALVVAHRILRHVDAGRAGDALRLLDSPVLRGASTPAALRRWAAVEAELAAGHPVRALRLVAEHVAAGVEASVAAGSAEPRHAPAQTLAVLAAAWGAFEAGESLPEFVPSPWPSLRAASVEFAALSAWSGGAALDDVAGSFLDAASAWAPVHRRGGLRCRWAAGEVLRRAGAIERAQDLLVDVEREAEQLRLLPLVSRARNSLRRSGARIRRPAAESRAEAVGPLSAREHEVLLLTGKGLTARAIAQQLGSGAATVETQIASAMVKLGAKSRLQAARIAKELTP